MVIMDESYAKLVRDWKRGWDEVERRRLEELRGLTMIDRWEQMAQIEVMGCVFGPKIEDADTIAVRDRWAKLRLCYERTG